MFKEIYFLTIGGNKGHTDKEKIYRHELHALDLWTRTILCLLKLENMQGLILPYGHFRAFNLIKPICQPVACQSLITLTARSLMWKVKSLHKCTPWGSLRWSCASLHLYLLTRKGNEKIALRILFLFSLMHSRSTDDKSGDSMARPEDCAGACSLSYLSHQKSVSNHIQ